MAKDDPYQELRPLMFSIVYRMLGSVSEAEDIVQEAFLRLHVSSSDGAEIRSPKAFLSAVERAVFLLREVFDYGYEEIATILGKNEDNCRQLAVRARRQVEARRPRFEAARRQQADGGGLALAFPRPVHGRENVARLLLGIRKRVVSLGLRGKLAEINGQPGALFVDSEGGLVVVVSLDIRDAVQTVRAISNPEKLSHLGPVSDVLARPHE